jgi:hypothetical protein
LSSEEFGTAFTIDAAPVNALDFKSYNRFLVGEAAFEQLRTGVK